MQLVYRRMIAPNAHQVFSFWTTMGTRDTKPVFDAKGTMVVRIDLLLTRNTLKMVQVNIILIFQVILYNDIYKYRIYVYIHVYIFFFKDWLTTAQIS